MVALRDGRLETAADDTEVGIGLRVVRDGSVGFAATVGRRRRRRRPDWPPRRSTLARTTALAGGRPVELADEPAHGAIEWTSPYRTDPTAVPLADKVALLGDWSERLLRAGVDHVTAYVLAVSEEKHFADLAGTTAVQRRVRVHPQVECLAVGDGGDFEAMRTVAPPVGRGWEYLAGDGWDWDAELAELPDQLAEKLRAPSVEAGNVRPRRRPDEPLADDPRVDRPRHRARPGAGLRGGVRRHVVRHARPARSPPVRVTGHARDRRPHDRARPGDGGDRRRGRRGPVVRPGPRRRPRRLPARPADRHRGRPRPLERLRLRRLRRSTSRSSGWRTSRCSRPPATGRRPTS